MAVRELGSGAHHLWQLDVGAAVAFASQVAKVVGAEIPDEEKKMILGGNHAPIVASQIPESESVWRS